MTVPTTAPTRVLLPAVARPVAAFSGRHPGTTGLYRVMQEHLGTFDQSWTDERQGGNVAAVCAGRTAGNPRLWNPTKRVRASVVRRLPDPQLVAFSCKGRGFCPSCGRGRMAAGAANLDALLDRIWCWVMRRCSCSRPLFPIAMFVRMEAWRRGVSPDLTLVTTRASLRPRGISWLISTITIEHR